MRLYSNTVSQFLDDVQTSKIADYLAAAYEDHYKRQVNRSEYNSWHYSLRFIKDSIDKVDLKDCYIAVETELPYTARRIDVLLFGKDQDNRQNMVLVELKQWTEAEESGIEGNVLTALAGGLREVEHPCLQVRGYQFELQDSYGIFEDPEPINLNACVFCHNYDAEKNQQINKNALLDSQYSRLLEEFPLFVKQDVEKLGLYLRARLSQRDGLQVFNRFDRSAIQPSKRLLKEFSGMIKGQQIFNLLDEQIAAYNAITYKVSQLTKFKKKSVIIIKGGPGTGKSVIALEAMVNLMQQGKTVFYATGSSALTNTLRNIAGKRASIFFKYFYSFTKHGPDSIDVLICDEAHRLRAHSNDWGVPFVFKSKKPQVDDLIQPASISVFLIDEHQVVRPTEVGSVEMIKEAAHRLGADIHEYELKTQFRCSGSDAYLQWIDKVLGITDSELTSFDAKMEFKIFNDPNEMREEIRKRNQEKENSARIVSGFCWPWSEPSADGSLVNDVKIGDFEMPWERKAEFWKWATDKTGMDQVGTVYTAQGFEFDYVGVIFGNDLIYDPQLRDWVSRPENSFDSQLKRKNPKLTEHLKNVYRVLMSRAHHGVYVHFLDKSTEKFFKENLRDITT
jgi:uncharacterized protein